MILERVDGHMTSTPGLGLLVLVADCYPVALSDGQRAAMLHCGWRPLAAGIVETALATFESVPSAAVGPGIGGCCYEVGPEVLAEFEDLDHVADGRMLDLRAVISQRLERAGVSEVHHLDMCTSLPPRPLLLAPPRQGRHGPPGRTGGARCALRRFASNLERIREEIGPDIEILAATKYVADSDLPALAEAGIELVGENRAQDMLRKQEQHRDLFTWDFIGAIQSRKLKDIAPNVRLIHSIASESALRRLEQSPAARGADPGERGGRGVEGGDRPARSSGATSRRCPCPVTGLMTMPPFVERPEDNRRHFARLAELAAEHGLERLSMGTSQDYAVAAEEGATIVRLGSVLYEGA